MKVEAIKDKEFFVANLDMSNYSSRSPKVIPLMALRAHLHHESSMRNTSIGPAKLSPNKNHLEV